MISFKGRKEGMIMAKKKPKKKGLVFWAKNHKAVVTGLASIIGIFGLVWGLDNHWLPREIHSICMAQVEHTLQGLQKQMAVQSAEQMEFYWRRKESELKTEARKNPNNIQVKQEWEEATIERRRAEDRVKELQSR